MSRISKYWVSPPSWIGPTRRPRVESRWCAFFRLSQKIVHTTDEGGSNFACSISDRAQSRIVGHFVLGKFQGYVGSERIVPLCGNLFHFAIESVDPPPFGSFDARVCEHQRVRIE